MEDEEHTEHEGSSADSIVPFQFFAEVGDGENRKDGAGDDFLDGLELGGIEFVGPDAVGGDLEAVLKESDALAGDDDSPKSFAAVLEMAVPGKGHEDVGDGEQDDGAHEASLVSRVR